MKYCRLTGPTGLGKSYYLKHHPVPNAVQIVDLLKTKELELKQGIRLLILDHADCELDAAKELASQAEALGLDYILFIGQTPSDLDSIFPSVSWELELQLTGGFKDLTIKYSYRGNKAEYNAKDLPMEVEGINEFLSRIRHDLSLPVMDSEDEYGCLQ